MRYHDFTIVITTSQPDGYTVSAQAEDVGRVSAVLPLPSAELRAQMKRALQPGADTAEIMRQAGEAMFRWVTGGGIESHLRVAWDRARRVHEGMRLRLSIDAPELAAWPWELLHDPERDYPFATALDTLLVRYFDQSNHFGGLSNVQAELPLDLLLVLPAAPDLNLAQERANLNALARAMPDVLRLRVLDGVVTRADLADALLLGSYDIVHFGGHGAFIDGRGYVSLNTPDGGQDWIDSGALSRLAVNHKSVKLVVLNACNSGQVDDVRAFQGLAPQMVRYGVPAVVAMQYPIHDDAAATFAREFYKRLCVGKDAGQVDIAVSYARNMLTVLHAGEPGWAAPVLFTHAADGVIYRLPETRPRPDALDPVEQRARLAALTASLQASLALREDWALADPALLVHWDQVLHRAEESYRVHLADPRPEVQQVAQQGLMLVRGRLAALGPVLAAAVQAA